MNADLTYLFPERIKKLSDEDLVNGYTRAVDDVWRGSDSHNAKAFKAEILNRLRSKRTRKDPA